jgi:hypothetical protein
MNNEQPDNDLERTFYRKLFIRRYILLLEKAQRLYSIDESALTILHSRILSLDWIDGCIARLNVRMRNN